MPVDLNHITQLLYRMVRRLPLSAEEQATLDAWAAESEYNREVVEAAKNEDRFDEGLRQRLTQNYEAGWKKLRARIGAWDSDEQAPAPTQAPVHRVHFLKTAWFKYAAAILIIAGISTYLWNTQKEEKPAVTKTSPYPVQNDVAPGGNKATLTLADGRKIILDSAAVGTLAKEQGASVIKQQDGQIIYQKASDAAPTTVAYNTMSTPRGGQYQLVLPDGSRVWLNAASSITYPTNFTGNQRNVSITGEAYFEVAKDKSKPFKVQVNPTTAIEVLGTHFNVNAYAEEATVNTTLLEGSIKLSATQQTTILKPNQQGQVQQAGNIELNTSVDIESVMAWKNGAFNFNAQSMEAALRQLSRWYDVEIVFDKGVPTGKLAGEMGRSLTLLQVLKGLEGVAAHFRLEGKKLHVTPLSK